MSLSVSLQMSYKDANCKSSHSHSCAWGERVQTHDAVPGATEALWGPWARLPTLWNSTRRPVLDTSRRLSVMIGSHPARWAVWYTAKSREIEVRASGFPSWLHGTLVLMGSEPQFLNLWNSNNVIPTGLSLSFRESVLQVRSIYMCWYHHFMTLLPI